jgi:hypothetical protein
MTPSRTSALPCSRSGGRGGPQPLIQGDRPDVSPSGGTATRFSLAAEAGRSRTVVALGKLERSNPHD